MRLVGDDGTDDDGLTVLDGSSRTSQYTVIEAIDDRPINLSWFIRSKELVGEIAERGSENSENSCAACTTDLRQCSE